MKSTALALAIATASLGFGSLSYAQGYDRDGRDGRGGWSQRAGGGEQREQRRWNGGQQRHEQPRHFEQRAQPPQHGAWQGQPQHRAWQGQPQHRTWQGQQQHRAWQGQPQHRAWQGQPQWQYNDGGHRGGWAAQAPRFRAGDYLPHQYRQRQFYVNDWRAHRLYAPPQGYQWVQADTGDYLLIAIASGLIANLLLGQ